MSAPAPAAVLYLAKVVRHCLQAALALLTLPCLVPHPSQIAFHSRYRSSAELHSDLCCCQLAALLAVSPVLLVAQHQPQPCCSCE